MAATVAKDAGREDVEQLGGLQTVMKYGILGLICLLAFCIRLFAVVRYESVIHEFDPYFNFRTTKYLAHEGFLEFLNWFDDRGWYPLGRTIGGTIYPGLMLSAATLHWFLNFFFLTVNIRDVCVFLAPLFSGFAAVASYLLTTEVTKRSSTGLLAAAFTAIVPSYISRSVGGSYDNEGVAIFALIFTFYLWIKAVNTGSLMWACFCALSYYYMVAAWGGYVFIINVIPIYTLLLMVAGRFSSKLYIAYSCFYTLGSLMAMTVPFVGFNVINQAECAGSHGVFVAVQAYAFIQLLERLVGRANLKKFIMGGAAVSVMGVAAFLLRAQLDGSIQWSGRSLTLLDPTYASKFIPIIASVSEHQPTTWSSFFFDLHALVPLSPLGLAFLFQNPTDGAIFVILYGTLAWYFAGVMVRLMLTLAPIACILAAVGLSTVMNRMSTIIKNFVSENFSPSDEGDNKKVGEEAAAAGDAGVAAAADKPSKKSTSSLSPGMALLMLCGSTMVLLAYNFHASYVASIAYSAPSIVIDAGQNPQTGERVLWDDYREAYFWLRQNTHEDSKILSWWDYGYQMSAMANRTVLVDNNTWNNTHIATVGRALASTEEKAYPILESLDVDYVLVIFGGVTGYSSDDINKFLWPVRIGSGVFPDDMPGERDFYSKQGHFDIGDGGAPALLDCVAYKLCYYNFDKLQTEYGRPTGYDRARKREVGRKNIQLETMEEAFTSEHWIVRIFKVLKRPALTPTKSAKRLSNKLGKGGGKKKDPSSSSKSKGGESEPPAAAAAAAAAEPSPTTADALGANFKGCYTSELYFEDARVYHGGASGASFSLAFMAAKARKAKYFAMARVGDDGHSFSFNAFSEAGLAHPEGDTMSEGCTVSCTDADSEAYCGCADAACGGDPMPPGEEHNRRWMVYEIIDQ